MENTRNDLNILKDSLNEAVAEGEMSASEAAYRYAEMLGIEFNSVECAQELLSWCPEEYADDEIDGCYEDGCDEVLDWIEDQVSTHRGT